MCGYTILSIHHHVVLHAYKAEAQRLSNLEIGERWHKLYKSTLLTQESVKDKAFDEAQWLTVKEKLDEWRLELANIRRWMWALNEPITRMANYVLSKLFGTTGKKTSTLSLFPIYKN